MIFILSSSFFLVSIQKIEFCDFIIIDIPQLLLLIRPSYLTKLKPK